jgi:hypothetical protein
MSTLEKIHETDGAQTSNFIRAFLGETLTGAEIVSASRRIILVCAPRRISTTDAFAMIELPPARRWEARDIIIVGTQFCLAPHGREIIRGDTVGHHAVRLVPLISDRHEDPDGWVVVG